MLEQARGLCDCCLRAIELDAQLSAAQRIGVTIWVDGQAVAEVIKRWPDFLQYVVENNGMTGFAVPPRAAPQFVRTLARAVMH